MFAAEVVVARQTCSAISYKLVKIRSQYVCRLPDRASHMSQFPLLHRFLPNQSKNKLPQVFFLVARIPETAHEVLHCRKISFLLHASCFCGMSRIHDTRPFRHFSGGCHVFQAHRRWLRSTHVAPSSIRC